MFIRQVKKQRSQDSKIFYQYCLVQASRVEGKVKQRIILYLGSDPLLMDATNRKTVLEMLKAKIFKQASLFPENPDPALVQLAEGLFEKYLIKYDDDLEQGASIPPAPETAEMHQVNIKNMEVKEVRSFGAEHLCSQVIEKLQLRACLKEVGFKPKQTDKALIAIAARAIFSSSEHKTAQSLAMNSNLTDCFNYQDTISHKQLYRIADKLFEHKDTIDSFLYKRITDLFGLEDRLVIFDISNTYFETSKKKSTLAKYGRSKEKRYDCPLVVFTGVINPQGFLRHSRIYEGNKADPDTMKDMLKDLNKHSDPRHSKTVVLDAGIASEENLELILEKGYQHVCVSRKRLKTFSLKDQLVTQETTAKQENVKLSVFHPKDHNDTWTYVQSDAKKKKETSMTQKLTQRFEEELEAIDNALSKKGGTKKLEKVWERIGRVKERHPRASGQYKVEVDHNNQGTATKLRWKRKESPVRKEKEKGVYFIRTSYKDVNEKELWDIYNTIREVESTFRCLKSDLQIRPVHHQKDQRVEAHIYLTLLAYQLVNTIRHMLKAQGINYDWANIRRIMATHTVQTIELPTDTKTIHLRKPSKPIEEVQQIYHATGCTETQKATKKYVVYH